jgi:hypothetical protein
MAGAPSVHSAQTQKYRRITSSVRVRGAVVLSAAKSSLEMMLCISDEQCTAAVDWCFELT